MDLSQFAKMDPHLLVGLVNTRLRNEHDSLEDLCRTEDIDEAALKAHLASMDYHYLEAQKQFR